MARASLLVVESLDRKGQVVAQGSGVTVGEKAVVTAWPLVSRAFSIRVRSGHETRPAHLYAVLDDHGLARLEVEGAEWIVLGRDALPLAGVAVLAVGSAQGGEQTLIPGTTAGLPEAPLTGDARIAVTPSFPAGFAGGALLDVSGALIGILAPTRAGEALGVAVPVRRVKDLLAVPKGTLPKVKSSPLLRLSGVDRQWVLRFMNDVALQKRPFAGLDQDRVNALLDSLDPLVGAELDRVKTELGLGVLARQRLFWEDAIEARAFRRPVRTSRRAEMERSLVSLGLLTAEDLAEGGRIVRAIAAHEPFDLPGARIDATEPYLAQMVTRVDQTRRRIETQLWEARSR